MVIFPESWDQSTPWRQALPWQGKSTEDCGTAPPSGYICRPMDLVPAALWLLWPVFSLYPEGATNPKSPNPLFRVLWGTHDVTGQIISVVNSVFSSSMALDVTAIQVSLDIF